MIPKIYSMPKKKSEAEPPTRTPEQVAQLTEAEKVAIIRDLEHSIRTEKDRMKDVRATSKDLIADLETQKYEILEPGPLKGE